MPPETQSLQMHLMAQQRSATCNLSRPFRRALEASTLRTSVFEIPNSRDFRDRLVGCALCQQCKDLHFSASEVDRVCRSRTLEVFACLILVRVLQHAEGRDGEALCSRF
jgi:hypothetical protein